MLRDIQIQIDNHPENVTRMMTALQLAAKQDSVHLIGVHALKTPEAILYGAPHGITGYFPEEVIQTQRENIQNQANELRKVFEEQAEKAGISHEWRQLEGREVDIVAFHARFTDLTIISQSKGNFADELEFSGSLLMENGLPILAVPHKKIPDDIAGNILIAWNGSPEAARAVKGALPLLKIARKVVLLSVGETEEDSISQNDIANHLSRHGIICKRRTEQSPFPEDIIMGVTQSEDIGLIVAGAWGHSRIREMIFGGVTKSLFANQQIPVLLSH
ncbi:universal stress protein [Kiloniella laminariae]|uniref:universal stress protein n=1 Tax=Kiloniella laminariae TaxID=454162 RepID=UPI00036E3278|nr:universal stress protein [Kiloniella laminariae]